MSNFAPLLNIGISLAIFILQRNTPVLNETLQMCAKGLGITDMTLATICIYQMLLFTVCRSVHVVGLRDDVKLRVDGFRLAAFVSVESEEPTTTRAPLGAYVYHSHVTVPYDTQHGVLLFLDEVARLQQNGNIIKIGLHGRSIVQLVDRQCVA